MRIISQDGTIDVDYDNTTLFASDRGCLYAITGDRPYILLAKYPSIEVACNVMSMVRTNYIGGFPAYRLPFYTED